MFNSEQQDKYEFLLAQRRKFLKEMTALTGFALVTSAQVSRAETVLISGDPSNGDKDWGTVKGQLVFKGDIPEPEEVDLEKVELTPEDLQWFRSAGPILSEDWVINKENRGVEWVFVYLVPLDANENRRAKLNVHESLAAAKQGADKYAIIDQKPEGYVPHAVAIEQGMGVKMRNTGPVAHVFKMDSFVNGSFSKAMPPGEEIDVEDFKKEPAAIKISCPPHPWEGMHLRVFDHPYFAVTDENGNFEIKNAPAGPCRLVVWHESIGFKPLAPADELKGLSDRDLKRRLRNGDKIEIEGGAVSDLGKIELEAKTTKDG